ncbi:MAG: DUF389 domain-containing protein [Oscillatoriaceae cyanobacterium]
MPLLPHRKAEAMAKVTQEDIKLLRQNLMEDAELDLNYIVLAVSSAAIATMGLINNSPAAIIGAMIVAPLMLGIRGVAMGALEGDLELFRKSFTTVVAGSILGISLAWLIGRVVNLPASEFGSEIQSRIQPNLVDLGVAIAAGAISGFAKIRPKVSDTLAGTAIAVALMPPLCVVGLSLSQAYWGGAGGAFLLFFTNFLGIALACMIIFIWGGYVENHNPQALGWTLVLTGAIVFPLFFRFWNLLQEAQIRSTLKETLVKETITVGQQVERLDRIEIDWTKKPPEVRLNVRSTVAITPKQVQSVEEYLYKRIGRQFTLVFEVSQVREVRATTASQGEPPVPSPRVLPRLQRTLTPAPKKEQGSRGTGE